MVGKQRVFYCYGAQNGWYFFCKRKLLQFTKNMLNYSNSYFEQTNKQNKTTTQVDQQK